MKTVNIREVSLDEIADLPVHPVADIFPMLAENSSDRESGKVDKQTITLAELADSILENGLQEPIVLFDTPNGNMLLDGRNRRAACILAKVETVLVEDFIGSEEEAETYVLNLNIDRRDLTPGQRAFAAAKYWEMEARKAEARMLEGRNQHSESPVELIPQATSRTRSALGNRFRVNEKYVEQAHKELDAIIAARTKATELQREADELEHVEQEAVAKIELAKAEGKTEVVKEVAKVLNEAKNNKEDLRERAAIAAETASSKERRASRVQRGETMSNVYSLNKASEATSDDPVGRSRTRFNGAIAVARKEISTLAVVGDKADNYNYVGGRLEGLLDHFKEELG